MKGYDAIVVGAGPAGTTAALRMAREGLNVLLLERGSTAGSKNMFGGMFPRCPAIEELVPHFWDVAPWERHVVKRTLTILSDTAATSLAFESTDFDQPPYNGCTLYRPVFDRWYAGEAQKAGAHVVTECLVEDLLYSDKTVTGVRVNRGKEKLQAPIVIGCDGVLSLLSKKVGLSAPTRAGDMALGVKALFRLSENEINERFNVVRRQGVSQEFLGCTDGIRGGGFIYTQLETLSVGLVFHLDSLKGRGIPPYDLLYRFLAKEPVKKILKGAQLVEYSAHVLPEGGYDAVPQLYTDGLLLAGDAAGLCYTNGLNQEGMNLAITSGCLAAETVLDAFRAGNFSGKQLSHYTRRLQESFVLRDMKTFKKSAELMHNDRLFSAYPQLVGTIMEQLYRSDGNPKKGMGRTGWESAIKTIPLGDLIADAIKGGRSLI
jgi:electron transfer flavoprotein-quinone oxidoreductase